MEAFRDPEAGSQQVNGDHFRRGLGSRGEGVHVGDRFLSEGSTSRAAQQVFARRRNGSDDARRRRSCCRVAGGGSDASRDGIDPALRAGFEMDREVKCAANKSFSTPPRRRSMPPEEGNLMNPRPCFLISAAVVRPRISRAGRDRRSTAQWARAAMPLLTGLSRSPTGPPQRSPGCSAAPDADVTCSCPELDGGDGPVAASLGATVSSSPMNMFLRNRFAPSADEGII